MNEKVERLNSYLKNYMALGQQNLLAEQRQLAQQLKELLAVDQLNLNYFLALYRSFVTRGESSSGRLVISDKDRPANHQSEITLYPTAICTQAQLEELPITQYQSLKDAANYSGATDVLLWVKKMQAGTGSSVIRDRYLAQQRQTTVEQVVIGAKGTDLDIEHPCGGWISLAEVQILQGIADLKNGVVGEVVLHDIVSSQTASAVDTLWQNDVAASKPSISYDQFFSQHLGLQRFTKTTQHPLPTVDRQERMSFERVAPGGHALFGLDALIAAYRQDLRPKRKSGQVLIGSIGNGEDLGSSPDGLIVSWMAREQIPVVMVTTTKSEIDLKGGQLAVVPGKIPYITMLEKAQAESSDQVALFEQLGLRPGDRAAFFNTNMVLINYNVFTPLVEQLLEQVGEEQLLTIATPDLILNVKQQLDSSGQKQQFTQLEGAMGSLFLNLDRYWRQHYHKPLIHFLNIGGQDRTQFFSPIKTAFDYFVQTRSDRFSLCDQTFRLINHNCDYLPQVALEDSYYKSVTNVLAAFENCSILELKSLHISGKVDCSGIALKGAVSIINSSDQLVCLKDYLPQGCLVVEDKTVICS